MSRENPVNAAASIRGRLLNLARERGDDFQRALTQYALERLLYRLSRSPHAGRFTLKGAMLIALWMDEPHRRTRDLDLLGAGDPSPERLAALFRGLCGPPPDGPDDGLAFDPDSVAVRAIREENVYGGVRVRLDAFLGSARAALQVDVGFGDAVTPPPGEADLPVLLGLPAPRLRAYARETVIAEKLSALAELGLANSRMKDFYDLWTLGRLFPYDGSPSRRRGHLRAARGRPPAVAADRADGGLLRRRREAGAVGGVRAAERLGRRPRA